MGTFPHRHNPSARQDCFVFERPQVVFYCNFSCSRHVSKSANLIGRIVFDVACQTKKTNPRRFKKNDAFTRGVFRVGVHTHIGALCLVTRSLTSANIAREIRPGVYGPLQCHVYEYYDSDSLYECFQAFSSFLQSLLYVWHCRSSEPSQHVRLLLEE